MKEHWFTDSSSIHKGLSFQNTSISYNSVTSYTNFYVVAYSYCPRFWLIHFIRLGIKYHKNMTSSSVSRMHDSLIRSNIFLCNLFFVSCFGWHHLHSRFVLLSIQAEICFCISNQVFYSPGHNILRPLYSTNFSCLHKWNGSWLLVINMVYTSCLTICRIN